jgi:hypothetical protein
MSIFNEVSSFVNAPRREVAKFVLHNGMRLVHEAQADPAVRKRAEAASKTGGPDAGARVYEEYYVKRVKDALEPWNWF